MKSSFQTIILVIFIIAFAAAIAVFSGLFSSSKTASSTTALSGTVVVWGILPQEKMQAVTDYLNNLAPGYTVTYNQHDSAHLAQDITNALADGTPPDVILFSSETFSQFKNRLYTIPYAAYSERAYRDTNIDGAQIFLSKDGITALPLAVDPIVTYYNKDLLASANFVIPPATWSAVTKSVPIFTKHTTNGGISQVAIALGTDQNVTNVRDILSTLFLQTGSPIVSYNASTGKNVSELAGANINSNAQALAFYTSFANPSNTNYSWNNSLPSSLQMFLAGKSAYYIGRASELFTIQAQNPNLNFDVAPIFQPDGAPRQITFGSFVAVGVMKNAPNFAAAYAAASAFATAGAIDTISKQFSIPPVRRDLLQIQQNNPYISVFFRAALAAFSWPDPDPAVTEKIFRGMITSVNSGKTDAQGAIYDADTSLQSSIR